jgi:hypothetical protein
MHFCGMILDRDRIVAANVEGEFRVSTRRGGIQCWEGNVSVPDDAAIRDGETYTLRLADGREGEIHVGGGPYTEARGSSYVFKGNCRPPSRRLP